MPETLTVLAILAASCSLTCALLWNDSIQAGIARWFPEEQIAGSGYTSRPSAKTIWVKIAFALAFTFLAVGLLMGLQHVGTHIRQYAEKTPAQVPATF